MENKKSGFEDRGVSQHGAYQTEASKGLRNLSVFGSE